MPDIKPISEPNAERFLIGDAHNLIKSNTTTGCLSLKVAKRYPTQKWAPQRKPEELLGPCGMLWGHA